jgi:hypothetical protein
MRNDEQFQKDVAVYFYSNDDEFLGSGFLLKALDKAHAITCAHVLSYGVESDQGCKKCMRPISQLLIKTDNDEVLKMSGKYICPFEEYDDDKIKNGTQADLVAIELIDTKEVPAYEIWNGKYTQGAKLFFRGKPDKSSISINFYNNVTFDNRMDPTIFVIEVGQYLQLNYNEQSANNNTALSEIRGASGSGIFCYQDGKYFCLGVFKGLFDRDAVYGKGKGISICQLTDLLQLKETQIGSIDGPKFKPTLEWSTKNVNVAVKEAGKRFITFNNSEYCDLNFKTSTSKILDHITNTEFHTAQKLLIKFHEKLTSLIQNAMNGFRDIQDIYKKYESMVCPRGWTWEDVKNENLNKGNTVWFNEKHFTSLRELLVFEEKSTELTKFTHNFSVQLFNDHQFHELLNSFDVIYESAIYFLQEVDNNRGKTPSEFQVILPFCDYTAEIHSKIIEPFIDFFVDKNFDSTFNTDNLVSTAFFRHSFIKGEGLSGKTHLLCNYALKNIKNGNCTLLFFGNSFIDNKTPIKQMIDLLDLSSYNLSEDDFLYSLDWWGKKENRLVSICIDAINETEEKKVWKNHLIPFVEKIKQYHNINLIISVRDLEMDAVLTDAAKEYVSTDMALIEHRGFEDISPEVLLKFCEVFGIEAPKFPTLDSIFINPGLMFLLFENLKNRKINKIDDSILHISNIFNDFVDNLESRFINSNSNTDKDEVYVIPTTNIASKAIIDNDFHELIEYKEFKSQAEKIHEMILYYLKSEGVFSVKKERAVSFAYFSYQRFGNYFIALYLLSKFKSFEEIGTSTTIEHLFSNAENHESLIESLFRLTNEKYQRSLFDLTPLQSSISEHLKEVESKAFYSSNCYPKRFSKNLTNLQNLTEAERFELFEMLLRVSYKTHHSNKIDRSLHTVLSKFTMADLDCYWSPFISESFNRDIYFEYFQANNVFSLVDWVFQQENIYFLESESRKLYALTLSWFLGSSNRELRDLATKALVRLLMNNLKSVVELIKSHTDSKDLYILERLWAVAYGITLRSNNIDGLHELCIFTYSNIFSIEFVIPHILIRDYARGIIEYGIYRGIVTDIPVNKIRPPYKSTWPVIPNDNEIKELEITNNSVIPAYHSQSDIIQSMQVEYNREGVNHYGDFGRYVFQSCINHFDHRKEDLISYDLMNVAIKRVFSLGYDVLKHGEFDRNVPYDSRNSKKLERIGKKYQWIAMFELLAQLSDKFKFKDNSYDDETIPYDGPWQLYVRDYDPSILIRENKTYSDFKNSHKTWWQKHGLSFNYTSDSEKLKWLWTDADLPNFFDNLCVQNGQKNWFILNTFLKWDESRENKYQRDIWYKVKAIFINQNEVIRFDNLIKNKDLRNIDQLSTQIEHSFFLGEYPWHPMFKNSLEIDKMTYLESKIKIPIIKFSQSGETLDFSIDKNIQCDLPSPWLVKKMNLHLALNKPLEFINKEKETIFYDPSFVEGGSSATLISKTHLLNLLDAEDMTIAWIVGGEKNLYNSDDNRNWPGRQVLGGFYYWDGFKIAGKPWVIEEGR